jgi:hypothetical protein
LFDSLVAGIDPRQAVRDKARASLNPGIRAIGLQDDVFWSEIDFAAHNCIAAQIAGHSNIGEAGSPCARHEALAAAERFIGRDPLYRVLYSVIAPQTSYSASTNYPDPAKELLKQAAGCGEPAWIHRFALGGQRPISNHRQRSDFV